MEAKQVETFIQLGLLFMKEDITVGTVDVCIALRAQDIRYQTFLANEILIRNTDIKG